MADLKIFTNLIEPKAIEQIYTLANQPAFSGAKIRIMPDVHAGAGCVIGFTADLGNKVIPNIVGVDIGCGMYVVELATREIDFAALDTVIHDNIPAGRNVGAYSKDAKTLIDELICKPYLKELDHLYCSLGTLGGGNHFIEVDKSEDGRYFLVIHTGSRNLGKQVADIYQNIAIKQRNDTTVEAAAIIADLKAQGRQAEISDALKELKARQPKIPNELTYLEGQERLNYLHDMAICQRFAKLNRYDIAIKICNEMGWDIVSEFESIHNYIDINTNMVRKGAIDASLGKKLIIPLNMRDGCIIGIGKGNPDWNCSAPHGAGRRMSRAEAKHNLSVDEFQQTMEGIYTTSVGEFTLDEAPAAYKPMESIVGIVKDTIEILEIVKPVYNFKASN